MKILNLNIDELHLLSKFTDNGFAFNLGRTNNQNYSNVVFIDGENLCESSVFDEEFELSYVDGKPKLTLLEGETSNRIINASKDSHNVMLSSVVSIDGETLVDCVKLWGNDELIGSTELIALGIRNCENRGNYPFALLRVDKRCDYEVANQLFSCDTNEEVLKTEHKKCYKMEDIILSCLAGK